jgi:hypothetical protein
MTSSRAFLEGFDGVQAQPVEEQRRFPRVGGQLPRVIRGLLIDDVEHGALQRENEGGRLIGGKPRQRTPPGKVIQEQTDISPLGHIDVVQPVGLDRRRKHLHELLYLLLEFCRRDASLLRASEHLGQLPRPHCLDVCAALLQRSR